MVFELHDIKKSYGKKTVLDGVSLKLERGCYLLLGPNGAGKSTLMNIMVGLLKPTSGRIIVDGCNIKEYGDSYLECIGFAPQYPRFYPNYTVYEFLEYMSLIRESKDKKRNEKIGRVIERINLTDKTDSKIRTLSGGMRQRLGIAQALLGKPELIILDEPSAGLDPLEHRRFKNIVEDISKEMTVFMATHMVADIGDLNAQVMVLKNGKIFINERIQDILAEGKYGSVEDMYIECFEGN